jgi:hypothetical protein
VEQVEIPHDEAGMDVVNRIDLLKHIISEKT